MPKWEIFFHECIRGLILLTNISPFQLLSHLEHFRRSCRHGNGTGTGLYVQDAMQRALQQAFAHSSDNTKVSICNILFVVSYFSFIPFSHRNNTVTYSHWRQKTIPAALADAAPAVGAANRPPTKKIQIAQIVIVKKVMNPLAMFFQVMRNRAG